MNGEDLISSIFFMATSIINKAKEDIILLKNLVDTNFI